MLQSRRRTMKGNGQKAASGYNPQTKVHYFGFITVTSFQKTTFLSGQRSLSLFSVQTANPLTRSNFRLSLSNGFRTWRQPCSALPNEQTRCFLLVQPDTGPRVRGRHLQWEHQDSFVGWLPSLRLRLLAAALLHGITWESIL